ncbi:NAD(P)-dependent oxidoreductase [Shivajiella indica]|uniref:NAD(P)-dependent oxidoreductase n=1 Tax=Shivajiella indica TaxID=872115 RepID=A0ABW5B6D6_9BACT
MAGINKLLLLGATGRTGREVLDLALSKGYRVNVLVRDRKKVHHKHVNLLVFEGDTRIPKDLHPSMDGCQAVISCLNISRTSDFPWAPLRTPENFLSLTMKNLIGACHDKDVKRLVFTSAWGVGESVNTLPAWFSWLIDNSNIAPAYLEHERQESMVRNSGLDWTIVRPVGLVNSKKRKPVKVILNNHERPSLTISRKDTAGFLLDSLENRKLIHHIPLICS